MSGVRMRGSALTELLLCILPYGITLMGVIFLFHLAEGKQQLFKYVTSEAANPNGVDPEDFFSRLPGTANALETDVYGFDDEDAYDDLMNVGEEYDEPVMPYGTAGEDIVSSINTETYRFYTDAEHAGQVYVGLSATGRELQQTGVITEFDEEVGSWVDLEGLDLEGPEVNEDLMADISLVLGEWGTYRVSGATYSYGLTFGNERLPFEETDVHDFRRAGETTLGESMEYSASVYRAVDPAVRGTYVMGVDLVDLASMPGILSDTADAEAVDPEGLSTPRGSGGASGFYDKGAE